MGIESTSSVDVFTELASDGDKLVVRNSTGSRWFKITCDGSGDLVITDYLNNVVTILITETGSITPVAPNG